MSSDNEHTAIENLTQDPDDRFHITDERSANWLVRRINQSRAYAHHVEQWAAAELRRAQRDEQYMLSRYGNELAEWARRRIGQQRGKRKCVSLPAGVVGFRNEPTKLTVTDETRLLAWCRQHLPAAVKVIERVLASVVRDHITTSGELPDGAELRGGGGEKFFIK